MTEIQFEELQGEILIPGEYVELDLKSARVGLPGLSKKLLCVGHATAAGTANNNQAYPATTSDRAKELWGIGSQVAVMIEAALRVSPNLPIYGMSYAENGAATAAANTIVLATTATGPGTLTVRIAGKLFRVGVQKDDTPTEVGDLLAVAINAHPNLPVTAANVTGTVTLTARNKGPSGNTIRYNGSITSGIGMTAVFTGETLTGGATEGDPTTALAAIEGDRFHMIAQNTDDVTASGVTDIFKDHIEKMSDAFNAKWGFCATGCTGNFATALALTTLIDSNNMQFPWLYKSEEPCFELAAIYAAERARVVDRAQSLDDHELPGLTLPTDESVWPNRADERLAISEGVIPLRPERDGNRVVVVRNVVSKRTDVKYRDAEPFEIAYYIAEATIQRAKAQFSDSPLKTASPANRPKTVTPKKIEDLFAGVLLDAETLDYVQGTKKLIKSKRIKATGNPTDPTRIDIGSPLITTFPCHVKAFKFSLATPAFLE